MRYIQYFKTAAEEQAAIDNKELGKPYVVFVQDGQYIDWNTKDKTPDDRLIVVYNITGTGETVILNVTTGIEKIELEDGTVIPIANSYQFQETGLTTLYFTLTHQGAATRTYARQFYGCTSIVSVITPLDLTYLDYSTFGACSSLDDIKIPGVVSFANCAFDGCSSLTDFVLPSGLTGISQYCFRNCTGLSSVVVPESVGSMYSSCFYGCGSLTDLTVLRTEPPTLGKYAIPNTAYIYVPDASVSTYKAAQNWSEHADHIKGISEKPE